MARKTKISNGAKTTLLDVVESGSLRKDYTLLTAPAITAAVRLLGSSQSKER
jgi:hypothetical protein